MQIGRGHLQRLSSDTGGLPRRQEKISEQHFIKSSGITRKLTKIILVKHIVKQPKIKKPQLSEA